MYKRGIRLLSINYSSDCLRCAAQSPIPQTHYSASFKFYKREENICTMYNVQNLFWIITIWPSWITPLRWCSWERTIIFCPREKSLKNVFPFLKAENTDLTYVLRLKLERNAQGDFRKRTSLTTFLEKYTFYWAKMQLVKKGQKNWLMPGRNFFLRGLFPCK